MPRFLSRSAVLSRLRELSRTELVRAVDLQRDHAILYESLLHHFGTIVRARRAAGLTSRRPANRTWSRERVVAELRRLHRSGLRMSAVDVVRAGHATLVRAACVYVGAWSRAKSLAGIPDLPKRRSRSRGEWTADLVVAEILDRRRHGTPLAFSKVPQPLLRAGITHFGSWREAIEAAGLRYADIRLKTAYDDEELLDELRRLAAKHPGWTVTQVCRHTRRQAWEARFGSIEGAARAAGLVGWPHRLRVTTPIDEVETRRQLRARHRARDPMNVSAVSREEPALYKAAIRHFGTWDAAMAALQIPSPRRYRSWTRAQVLAALRERATQGMEMTYKALRRDDESLYQAIMGHVGASVADACRAAGVRYEGPVRRRSG